MPRSKGKAEGDVYRSMEQSHSDKALTAERTDKSCGVKGKSSRLVTMRTIQRVNRKWISMENDGKARSELLGRGGLCLVEACKDSQPAEESGRCVQITCSITHDKCRDARRQMITTGDGNRNWVVILEETDGAMMREWNGIRG